MANTLNHRPAHVRWVGAICVHLRFQLFPFVFFVAGLFRVGYMGTRVGWARRSKSW
jgi:hypothetical protein